MADAALQRRLFGQQDSRGPVGMMARGANVYNGASLAAHSGGGSQFGRPRTNPLQSQGQEGDIQPNLRMEDSGGLTDLNPQPINLLGAIQRRLSRSSSGI